MRVRLTSRGSNIHPQPIRKLPPCGCKSIKDGQARVKSCRDSSSQRDAIALYCKIEIKIHTTEQQVTDDTAHKIDSHALPVRQSADSPEQSSHARRQPAK